MLSKNKIGGTITTIDESSLHQLDSLKILVGAGPLTIEDLPHIIKIQREYEQSNIDSALAYANKQILLSEKIGSQNLIANARLIKSTILWRLIKPDLAEKLLQKNIANKRHIADTLLAESLLMLARVEIQQKKPTKSFQHAIVASEIYAKMNDSINSAVCFAYIAGIHVFILDEPENSIIYFEKALAYNNYKNELNVIRLLINYSTALAALSRFDEALEKTEKAEIIARKSKISEFDASLYIQYALIYNTTKDYEKSLKYSLLSDSILNATPNYDLRTQEKINWYLALNYKALENYEKAIYYFKSLDNSYLLDSWTVNIQLVDIYKELGEFEQAFILQEKVIIDKDSIEGLRRTERLKEITEKYESEKSQQEIITLSIEKELQKNQIRQQHVFLFVTIGFFLLLIGFGFYRYRTLSRLKETTQNLEKTQIQQRFLRTQLNPHFFFHALTSIESYIYENDKNKATSFLRDFSKLMRNILEFSDLDFISLQDDLDFIEKYISLQQLNHDFQFDYQISVSDDLDPKNIFIPPMLIQPAVENAILYGALSTDTGVVKIDYSKNGELIEIRISDNGKTRTHSGISMNKLNRSMSTDITKKRILNLKEVYGIKIGYESFFAQKNDTGSSVVFSIPTTFIPNPKK